MKTTALAALLLTLAAVPPLRADDPKPADPPKAEEPKKEEEPKSEEKKEEPKPEEAPRPRRKPKYEEQQSEQRLEKPQEERGATDPPERKAQEEFAREATAILKAWEPAVQEARRSTVQILRDGKGIAYGCSVHENGYIVTKASELQDRKGAPLNNLFARLPEGLELPTRIVDVHRAYDLALLRVEARGLKPVAWNTEEVPEPGTFIAAPTPDALPVAAGVVSVTPRSLDEWQKGWLGVGLDKIGQVAVKVTTVAPNSPASRAGLVTDDVLKSIDGQEVKDVDEFIKIIAGTKPYQTVKIKVQRDMEERELSAVLESRASRGIRPELAEDPRNMMAGAISKNRRGYADALQHDMTLKVSQVGGPVVDLKGRVIGMNIARSGRIESMAIPSVTMKRLLEKVSEGRLNHPELDSLRDERKNAEAALDRIKKDLEEVEKRIKDAEAPESKAEEKAEEKK
jgi:serine protease Do